MNNTVYARMQADTMNMANNIVTQMMCAEKGIDYNQLMLQAQQMQIGNIIANEQQRQLNQLVKKHYQGDTFFGKVRDAFGGGSSANMNMFSPVAQPFAGFVPQQGMFPGFIPQQQQQAVLPAPTEEAPAPQDDIRVEALEKDMQDIKAMLAALAQQMQQQD